MRGLGLSMGLALLACTSNSETEAGTSDAAEASESASASDSASETTASESETTAGETGGPPTPDASACEAGEDALLFGSPTANTGLGSDQCQPSCACASGEWTPPSYGADFIAAIEALELQNPPALLDADPYVETPDLQPDDAKVCAVLIEGQSYTLETYDDEASAAADGAWVTHRGACGQCSSLANLAVYVGSPDLTDPVRQCGLDGLVDGEQANIECLMALGFDEACAQIWYYNTNHTREQCLDICLAELENPNHLPDGSLNPCIQCDEDLSGAVFKAVSGRTRRNSGLPSALCRPCDSVYRVIHDYGLAG